MRMAAGFLILMIILAAASAQANEPAANPALLVLEKQIAYQQGRFGALYDLCSLHGEQAMIGGSLANWRTETFAGYGGTAQERAEVIKAFDKAATTVTHNADSCSNWKAQATQAWNAVATMAQTGKPVAAN